MLASRQLTRAALRNGARSARPAGPRPVRFQSTTASSSSSSGSSGSGTHFATGVAGGIIGAALFAGAMSYTPSGRAASKVNKVVGEAAKKYDEAAKTLQKNTPNADEAVSAIRHFAYSYVTWIPGGRQYIDTIFDDWEAIRKNHKEEADEIVNDAYKKFQDLSKSGLSFEKAYEILAETSKKIASLSGDALESILDNHPQLKEKFGGSIDELKSMGEQYGPEAKKQVEQTWKEVRDVIAGGLSAANLDKARKLIEDKVEKVKSLGDEAWKKGIEELKPYLDKSPKVKELVEKNADALRQGNMKELFDKARSAVQSGDLGDLQKYVDGAVDKAKNSGVASQFGLDKYLKMIPQSDEIWGKLQQIGKISEKHGEEGKKLLEETVSELKKVLEEKSKKAEGIADDVKQDAKKETK